MPPVLFILIILFLPFVSIAENAASGYVRVTLEYKSMFPGTIQVLDGVCRQSRSIECAKAGIKVNGETCRQKNLSAECKEAKALLDTSFCMEGLVYENRLSRGEKIQVDLCASEGGYGDMLVRDISKGSAWTNYFLLTDGQTVSFP